MSATPQSSPILQENHWNDLLGASPHFSYQSLETYKPIDRSIDVYVKATPIDTISIFTALFAAFFGSAAAFALSAFHERLALRRKQHDLVNKATYSLVLISNTLLNFKKQFLVSFESEFQAAYEILQTINLFDDDKRIEEIRRQVEGIFGGISKKSPTLNDLFRVWEEIRFIDVTAPEDLAFSVEEEADLVRLLTIARSQVFQIGRNIQQRNINHERWSERASQDAARGIIGRNMLRFWLEMLTSKAIIRQYVDVALVVIDESLTQIQRFRKSHFKKRSKLGNLIFGKESWTIGRVPVSYKDLIPDKANYQGILSGVQE